jgi:regulatory protein
VSSKSISSVEFVLQKIEHYCSYQERCHEEVIQKLFQFSLSQVDKDTIIVHLIENDFLNEERFANLFTISKLHQKKWGKVRIKNELKLRKISNYLISNALKQISLDEYDLSNFLI